MTLRFANVSTVPSRSPRMAFFAQRSGYRPRAKTVRHERNLLPVVVAPLRHVDNLFQAGSFSDSFAKIARRQLLRLHTTALQLACPDRCAGTNYPALRNRPKMTGRQDVAAQAAFTQSLEVAVSLGGTSANIASASVSARAPITPAASPFRDDRTIHTPEWLKVMIPVAA